MELPLDLVPARAAGLYLKPSERRRAALYSTRLLKLLS
jgi:hypothetical protein